MSARSLGMDFDYTPRQREIYDIVGELGRTRFAPNAGKHDEAATLPIENMRDFHAAGLSGLTVSEDLGGLGSGAMGNDPLLYLIA